MLFGLSVASFSVAADDVLDGESGAWTSLEARGFVGLLEDIIAAKELCDEIASMNW